MTRLVFLAQTRGDIHPMMAYTGDLQRGCERFSRLFRYDVFWVVRDNMVYRCCSDDGIYWRLIDGSSFEI